MKTGNSGVKGLVNGWQVRCDSDTNELEILIAETDDGRLFQSGPAQTSTEFDKAGREWVRIYVKPEHAHFIGRYPFNKGTITKFA